jgi:hypothetical protein
MQIRTVPSLIDAQLPGQRRVTAPARMSRMGRMGDLFDTVDAYDTSDGNYTPMIYDANSVPVASSGGSSSWLDDLFGNKGVQNAAAQAAKNALGLNQTQSTYQPGIYPMISRATAGLPSWALPAGLAVAAFLLIRRR